MCPAARWQGGTSAALLLTSVALSEAAAGSFMPRPPPNVRATCHHCRDHTQGRGACMQRPPLCRPPRVPAALHCSAFWGASASPTAGAQACSPAQLLHSCHKLCLLHLPGFLSTRSVSVQSLSLPGVIEASLAGGFHQQRQDGAVLSSGAMKPSHQFLVCDLRPGVP